MKFKTDANCEHCMVAIQKAVNERFPNADLKFEIENSDKVLHVHGVPEDSEHAAQIESAIAEAGFKGTWLTRGLENK